MTRLFALSSLVLGFAALTSAQENQAREAEESMAPKELIAIIAPTKGNDVKGWVIFKETAPGKVQITARVTGLGANSKHGFHIHEYGDISADDGTSAGGHFNPEGHPHGLPDQEDRHAGDLGNLEANSEGVAEKSLVVSNINLSGDHAVLGRAVIVHAKADTGAQPTGEAGERIAYGVIGIRNMKK